MRLKENQREILQRLVDGASQKEIGVAMGIHQKTVNAHLSAACTRVGARSTCQLVAMAVAGGVVECHVEHE